MARRNDTPLSRRLRSIREQRGLDQKPMAELLGIPFGTYVSYERGETAIPPFEYVYSMATGLGITMEELTDREPLGMDAGGVAKLREELTQLRQLRDDMELSRPFLARAYRDLGKHLRAIGEIEDE